MVDILDTTFCVLFKADSTERIQNFKAVVDYLTSNFKTHLDIIEVGPKSIFHDLDLKLNNNCTYNYNYDKETELNITRYRNFQTSRCKTTNIGLWDCDVIVPKDQILDCLGKLRSGKWKIASPFNGRLLELSPFLKELYLQTKNLPLIQNILKYHSPMYGNLSVGAAIFLDLNFYKEIGLDNIVFNKWGHEDCERVKRAEIFGADLYRSPEPAYHLYHPRLQKTPAQSILDRNSSISEFLKISSYGRAQLQSYIATW